MPDGGVDFTVRLVNQVTAPAATIKKAMGDVSKAFAVAKRQIDAPSPKRGPLSDWDKMASKAKMSQAADFAKQNAKLVSAQKTAQIAQVREQKKALKQQDTLKKFHVDKNLEMAQHHADHGLGSQVGEAVSGAAIGFTAALAAAALVAAGAVAYLGVQFVEASLDAAKFGEKATLAIGFLTNDAQQAGPAFDQVRHMAQGLGLEVDHTVEGFEKLLAAQFSIGKSKDLIKMGADMQAIGASAEEVQRIIYAMTEIKSIGSLQKRQERMLQMAGISGELIDQALMKHTGIKDKAGIDKARKGNKIGADVAIDAIMEAVMHKTHETKLGQAGAAFANQTLAGMQQQLKGGVENFFIDVGQKILPGVTILAKLVVGTIGKIANDPQVAALGAFLLNRFEIFTLWVQANWPEIEALIIDGLHQVGYAIRMVVDALDVSSTEWQLIRGLTLGLAVAIAALAAATFVLLLPLYLAIAAVGLVIAAFGLAIGWLIDNVPKWYDAGKALVGGLIDGVKSGLGALATVMGLIGMAPFPMDSIPSGAATAALPASSSSSMAQALASLDNNKTEGGKADGAKTATVTIQQLTVPQADDPQKQASLIGAAVRSEIEKAFHA